MEFFDRSISQVIERYITNPFTRATLALTCKEGYKIYFDSWVANVLNVATGKVIDDEFMQALLVGFIKLEWDPLKERYQLCNEITTGGLRLVAIRARRQHWNTYIYMTGRFCTYNPLGTWTFRRWITSICYVCTGKEDYYPVPNWLYALLNRWTFDFLSGDIFIRRKSIRSYKSRLRGPGKKRICK